jgi:serine/threonine protein kinase/tetratricopeptide (TPR) repeat protein
LLARDLHEGDVLDGKYRIVAPIGRGGMGAVYSAVRLSLGDTVAVKLLLPSHDQEMNRARFLREAKAAARIRHPSVVQVFDYSNPEAGPPYIVMELLEGPTLGELIQRTGPLPVDRALGILGDICAAVEAGHRRGVVHRDLKPTNVILARTDDGGELLKVLDFGIASVAGLPDATTLTGPGTLLGTCFYMAPEQAKGGVAGPESDVFSLGILLYEMVTGKRPFEAATVLATMFQVANGEYKPVHDLVPTVPPAVVAAITSALSVDIAGRPASPEALARLAGAPMRAMRGKLDTLPDAGDSPSRVEAISEIRPSWSDATMPVDAGPPDLERHFVGRTQELARIEEQLRAARAGSGKLTIVLGEPGAGKTRLVQAFATRAAAAGNGTKWVRFSDYEGSRLPPFDAVTRALDQTPPATAERVSDSERGGDKWKTIAAITESVMASARNTPLVLFFDDLQWARAVELDLVAHLQRSVDSRLVFLIATAHTPEPGSDLARWMGQLAQRRVDAIVPVGPLSSENVREWLHLAFGTFRIRPRDRRRIERATGNNPHHLLELMRHLLTSGAIRRDDAHGGADWTCADLEDVTLPESTRAVVHAKLADLDDDLRDTLEIASAIGQELRFATLLAASALREDVLEARVERAIDLRLLTEEGVTGGDDLRFASETIRRVLYDEMTTRRRKRAHQRVAAALHERYAKDLRRIARVLCYHHLAVGDHAEALAWGLAAAEDDLALYANDAAETSVQRARDAAAHLEEAGEGPAVRDAARLDALTGTLYVRLGRFADASEVLARAIARSEGDAALRIGALLDLAHCHLGRGDMDRALAAAGEAADRAAKEGDTTRTLAARVLTSACLSRLGRLNEAEGVVRSAIESAGADVALGTKAQALRELSVIATKRGAFALGEARARESLELARMARDPMAQHQAVSALAAAYDESGDAASALPFHLEALELARALSLRRREAIDLANTGEAHMTLDHVALAEQHFREALAIFREIGDRACEGDCRVNIGRALLARGARGAAVAMLERGRKLCESTGRGEYAGIALCHLGEAHRTDGDLARAASALGEAHQLFVQQASHNVWRASLGLARVALARGDAKAASAHAREAAEVLEGQRGAAAPGSSTATIDRSLVDIADVMAKITTLGRAPG